MLRWENYFMKFDTSFESFWKNYQEEAKPDILFIMGIGFDPRTNLGIESIFSFKSSKRRDTIALRYFKSAEEVSEPPFPKVKEHLDRLNSFLNLQNYPAPEEKNIILRSEEDKNIASVNVTHIFQNFSFFENYSDIIIDISAMPRGVFLPLINKCLDLIDNYNDKNIIKKNLHVIVSENSKLDSLIVDKGIEETATYIYGFRIKEIDKTKDQKEVWIPILGENQVNQFDKIKTELKPVEVCPILPFPCENLRRGDNLLIEYQDRLLNDNNVELKNIVHADESNPFQVYRLLSRTIQRYNDSFKLLSGCKIIVSALSSKLLTIGAFLAVYEKKKQNTNIGIMHVESLGHELKPEFDDQKIEVAKHNKLFEIWLAGAPYNE